jgi:hypothetical protein
MRYFLRKMCRILGNCRIKTREICVEKDDTEDAVKELHKRIQRIKRAQNGTIADETPCEIF